jgi:hypothetical protein
LHILPSAWAFREACTYNAEHQDLWSENF